MTLRTRLSFWLPDRPPTWLDLVVAAMAAVQAVVFIGLQSLQWPLFVVGTVVTLLVLGPVAKTAVGRQIDEWGRTMAGVTRLAVVFGLAVGLLAVVRLANVPGRPLITLAMGGLAGVTALVLLNLVTTREVDGWTGSDGGLDQ